MNRADRCWTCGRPRGLAQQRKSWGLDCRTVIVPRTENSDDKPAQTTNDLICHAGIWRNGGTNHETHLCDDCLRIGLRAMKLKIDALLGELEKGRDTDIELAELTERLGRLQARHHNVCFDHNRMQDRLRTVLEGMPDSQAVRDARFEVNRGPARS